MGRDGKRVLDFGIVKSCNSNHPISPIAYLISLVVKDWKTLGYDYCRYCDNKEGIQTCMWARRWYKSGARRQMRLKSRKSLIYKYISYQMVQDICKATFYMPQSPRSPPTILSNRTVHLTTSCILFFLGSWSLRCLSSVIISLSRTRGPHILEV